MISSSLVNILGNQVEGINTFTSIVFDSPVDSNRVITSIVQLVEENNNLELVGREFLNTTRPDLDEIQVLDVFPQTSEYVSVISGRVEDVISSSIVTTGRQITSTISHEIDNTALSNINYYQVGAYLDIDLDILDNIVYIPDTSKFKTNGYLLIGNEVVRYYRKLTDRFLNVQRAQSNTTAQFWSAGTFLLQIPDPISTAFAGVTVIESESQTVSMSAGAADVIISEKKKRVEILTNTSITSVSRDFVFISQQSIDINSISEVNSQVSHKLEVPFNIVPSVTSVSFTTEVASQVQIVHSEFNITKNSLEFLRIPPPSGAVDGYQESAFISDPIFTRLNGFVDLENSYGVVLRDLSIVYITNQVFGSFVDYIGNYEKTNAGPTIGNFASLPIDPGAANVSGLTILDISSYFPSLTLRDFTERAKSSYTLSGNYFNLTNTSIQNPVAISSSNGTIGGPIVVQSTSYFPESGYLFTSNGSVIQYTEKTSTQFGGCTLLRGPDTINGGDELIPYSIN
jgi:hypothetical protein